MMVCEDSDTTYTNVDSTADTRVLAKTTLSSGDYTLQDGDASGRKVTISSQDSVDIVRSGTAENLYILDTGNTEILLVTSITTQSLTTGGKVNIPGFDDEIADPT
jgi:hypothetical protein